MTAPSDEWSAAEILEHLTGSRYADLLDGKGYIPTEVPTTATEVLALKEFDGFVEFQRDGRTIRRSRQTILAQAIHHATEHRAQIAGIYSSHGLKIVDLDEIDLWAFANYEGLGD